MRGVGGIGAGRGPVAAGKRRSSSARDGKYSYASANEWGGSESEEGISESSGSPGPASELLGLAELLALQEPGGGRKGPNLPMQLGDTLSDLLRQMQLDALQGKACSVKLAERLRLAASSADAFLASSLSPEEEHLLAAIRLRALVEAEKLRF